MSKVNLTDRFIFSDARIPTTKEREWFWDSQVSGFALQATGAGHRSFILSARFPRNPKHPTRRWLGDCYDARKDGPPRDEPAALRHQHGALTLGEARAKARDWLDLIARGIDPKAEEARQRAAALRQQTNSFSAVATQFLERAVKGPAYVALERQAKERPASKRKLTPEKAAKAAKAAFAAVCADPANAALVRRMKTEGIVKKDEAIRAIEGDFMRRWDARPITDIQPDEAAAAIRAVVRRGTPYEAHNRLGHLRRLFSWAIGTQEFGITESPIERLSPKDLIGKREPRNRRLLDNELVAIWQATGGRLDAGAIADARRRAPDRPNDETQPMAYPYGPLFRLLVLTGQREREVAEMRWSEIDFDQAVWVISADRMKGGLEHLVPLAPDALALLRSLPRFTGDFVFSTTGGAKAVNGFSKAKARLNKLSGVGLGDTDGWKIHDLRRMMRTHLSALPVQDVVREAVIAHAKQGLHRVYDLYEYENEKRECLTLWENRLRGILAPKPPADVADLTAQRERRVAA